MYILASESTLDYWVLIDDGTIATVTHNQRSSKIRFGSRSLVCSTTGYLALTAYAYLDGEGFFSGTLAMPFIEFSLFLEIQISPTIPRDPVLPPRPTPSPPTPENPPTDAPRTLSPPSFMRVFMLRNISLPLPPSVPLQVATQPLVGGTEFGWSVDSIVIGSLGTMWKYIPVRQLVLSVPQVCSPFLGFQRWVPGSEHYPIFSEKCNALVSGDARARECFSWSRVAQTRIP